MVNLSVGCVFVRVQLFSKLDFSTPKQEHNMSLSRLFAVTVSSFQETNRQKSGNCLIVLLLTLIFLSASFATAEEPTLVDEKYSLKADREAFEALRKDIPPERQKENDEKAFMDQMMSDLSKNPSDVRSKFSSIINKKREMFNKDMTKEREKFSKEQTKAREAFSKEQAAQRKDFSKRKSNSDERKEFFDDLEGKRKDFYADQKEKRDEFEANTRDKRKNFDDYIRSKTDEFNQLHRDYSKRYDENKKAQGDLKKQAEEKRKQQQKNLDQEYDAIKKQTPTILAPQEQGQ